jgi:5'-3' exonuclease
LYIDGNCGIHPISRKVYLSNINLFETDIDKFEKKIIKEVINYFELIIETAKPTNTIYIAIDGVAPMAKIKHQRLRRFKSVYDRKKLEEIGKKHNQLYQKEWNSSAITPGTIFMDKLVKALLIWTKNTNYKANVILSSSYTPGEGEHKILQHIRNLDIKNDVNVIYGLDADLLFLSLALHKNNMFICFLSLF